MFCQVGVNCPSSAQWSLSFMCKLIAVTIKLQLVRQPAGHKWEFQTARVFLLEKQHLHNMSLQLFEMKNQKGKLPPHTPDLKVSIWVADGLDRAKSTTQKNSSCLVIWHSTRANVGGFTVFYADWIWATLPPNRTASFYSFYTYLSLQPLFHIFLSFAYGNEHQLKENNYRTEWQPHDTRSSTTVIGILRFFLFIHTPASQQHNHPLNWLTEHTWIKINPEKKSYYSQNMKLRWEPQANILLSQKAHKLILLVSKIYLNFMV